MKNKLNADRPPNHRISTAGRLGWSKKLVRSSASLIFCLVLADHFVRWFVPVRNVRPSFTIYDPTYGKRLKKSFSYCAPHQSLGCSSPRIRWAFVGGAGIVTKECALVRCDYFTLGHGVSDGQKYPALVAARVNEHYEPNVFPSPISVSAQTETDDGSSSCVMKLGVTTCV